MARIEQCPGFETFGADVKAAREKLGMSRRELAEKIGVDPRYLANIELKATIPSFIISIPPMNVMSRPAGEVPCRQRDGRRSVYRAYGGGENMRGGSHLLIFLFAKR